MAQKLRMKATVTVKQNNGPDGKVASEDIQLNAVTGDSKDNKKWAGATPIMSLNAQVANPEAFGSLEGVKEVYVDIIPIDQ